MPLLPFSHWRRTLASHT